MKEEGKDERRPEGERKEWLEERKEGSRLNDKAEDAARETEGERKEWLRDRKKEK